MKQSSRDLIITIAFSFAYLAAMATLLLMSDVHLEPEQADALRGVLVLVAVVGFLVSFAARWIPVRDPEAPPPH